MDALEAVTKRVSVAILTEPKVTTEQKNTLFRAALRAPDHAWVRPSRYITIEGDARQRLGEYYLAEELAANAALSDEKRQKMSGMLLRAPLVIVAVTRVTQHPKVPRDEQILSTGAGIQNILTASWAMGLGAIWRTGDMVHSQGVRDALGLNDEDVITGFIYVGHINTTPKPVPDINLDEYVTNWTGENAEKTMD